MRSLRVIDNQFDSHPPEKLVTGSINTDQIKFILDSSWEGLTVYACFLNTEEGQERTILLDDTLKCTIPWECCSVAGALNIGILGRDGAQVVKPSFWHLYGYVVDGVSPDGGIATQAHTTDVLDQMMELQNKAAASAQAVADAVESTAQAVQAANNAAQQAQVAAQCAAEQAAAGASDYAQQASLSQECAEQAASLAQACQEATQAAMGVCSLAQQQAEEAANLAKERASQTNDLDLALRLGLNYARQNAWLVERGEVQLINNGIYPFNNSAKTVALSTVLDTSEYGVITEAIAFTGNVGEIVVTDRLANGFKLGYTGSAKSATIKYTVVGGLMK